jgi:general secretion pathway protein D
MTGGFWGKESLRTFSRRRRPIGVVLAGALIAISCGVLAQQLPVVRPPAPAAPSRPLTRATSAPGPAAPAAVAPAAASAGTTVPDDEPAPGLKFKSSPMEMVLKDYAEKTHRTILQAPGLPNVNITLESQPNLTMDEYLEAIETVLAMNGIGILTVGEKFLKVVPIAAARQEPMEITEKSEDAPLKENDTLISQMIPLKHIDLAEAVKAITPLKHAYGQIHTLERSNSILITDSAATINRINQIIKYIDQPIEGLEEPIIKEIRYAKAADIKKKLEEIIADAKKDAQKATVPRSKDTGSPGVVRPSVPTPPGVIRATPPTPTKTTEPDLTQLMEQVERGIIRGDVKMIADDRTNILILITRPENMQFFDKIIKVLDVETAPDVIVKVVRLEYAEAEQVASTLNTLIGQVSKGPDVKTPTTAGDQKGESAVLREYVERLQKEREAAASAGKEKEKSKVGELSAENIKILPDKRTNSLLIMASKADFATLEEMIKGMDIMLSQVMIEVVIFKITLLNSYERGIDWVQRAMVAYDKKSGGGNKAKVAFAGSGGGDKYRASMKEPLSLTTLPSLSSTAGNLTYFCTFFDLNLDAIIKLIASDNRTQIVSSPTILTTDNKKATIDVTTEKYFFKGLKFVSTSGSGAGEWVDDVEMKKVGTKLAVTPRINAKKHVVMEINQSLEEEGGSQKIQGAGGASDWPTIDSADMSASVAVRSGETIVLGGLVSNSKINNKSKVPILGEIPLIGVFFQYRKDENTRNEILVFITPYVLDTPEEIEERVERRKNAMSMSPNWPPASDSKMAKKARGEPDRKTEESKMGDGKSEEKVSAEASSPSESPAAPAATLSDMDPELVEFIKRQDKKYDKKLKNVDKNVDRELRERESPE